MKPTARFNQRYISFLLTCGGRPLPYSDAKDAIHSHFLSFFGEAGISSLAFKLMKYSDADGKGIVRCERKKTDEAIFCMACLTSWKGKPARLEPLSTSGTIKRTQLPSSPVGTCRF